MFDTFFGDIRNGRLPRLPYLGYSLLVSLLLLSFVLAIIVAIGAGKHLIGGDIQQAQAKLRQWVTLPFMVVFGLFMAMVLFVSANLKAKRLRDIGLPGWWLVLVIAMLTGDVRGSLQSSQYWSLLVDLARVGVDPERRLRKRR